MDGKCYVCGAKATCICFRPLCDAHASDMVAAAEIALRRLKSEWKSGRPDPRQTSFDLEFDNDSSRG